MDQPCDTGGRTAVKHRLRTVDVDGLELGLGTPGGGEGAGMNYGIHPAAGINHGAAVAQVDLYWQSTAPEEDLHARVVAIEVAAEQVDGMAVLQELAGGVSAEEARGAGEKNLHAGMSIPMT